MGSQVFHRKGSSTVSLPGTCRSDLVALERLDLSCYFQSFAKNAGLYGERVGALHVVSPNKETAERVKSQLSVLQRSEISNPPTHGARLVSAREIKRTSY